jgi:hypothetical protein
MSDGVPYDRSVGTTATPHSSSLEAPRRLWPRYRWRTWIRGRVPWALVDVFPRGWRDCGQHEWYREDEETDRCYHCMVGVRPHQLMEAPIDHQLRIDLLRAAQRGSVVAAEALERRHATDRALGRPRWHPPEA